MPRPLDPTSRRALQRELERLTTRREPARLERIVEAADALERLRSGEYGICTDCCGRIPIARLRACPEARRCVACQQRQDEHLAA